MEELDAATTAIDAAVEVLGSADVHLVRLNDRVASLSGTVRAWQLSETQQLRSLAEARAELEAALKSQHETQSRPGEDEGQGVVPLGLVGDGSAGSGGPVLQRRPAFNRSTSVI